MLLIHNHNLQWGRRGDRLSARTPSNQPVDLAKGIHRLFRVRVQVRKRDNSQREVLSLNHPTVQFLADISARVRPKNESVGVGRPVDRASMVYADVHFVERFIVLA